MMPKELITNDRQERETASRIREISNILSSENILSSILDGLPTEVKEGFHEALAREQRELEASLQAYQKALAGDATELTERAGNDIGALLVAARVSKGWKQKDLARRLFLPEQQIQRYEIERYRSISLSGLIRVARTLGLHFSVDISKSLREPWLPSHEMAASELQKVVKHARSRGWLEKIDQSDEAGVNQLRRTVAEHVGEYGTPLLLRTGLNVIDHSGNWLLLAWKAQVTRIALKSIREIRISFRLTDISWLTRLVRLSALPDGPVQAKDLLAEHGITLVLEPHIIGMNIDGAAFLVGENPVIGLTLRLDRVDNFWFTLLHEVAHVILHYRTGLSSGFFDTSDAPSIDELETEADRFASELLIPSEVWSKAAARIAKSPEPIEKLARKLNIAPEIVFGRIRLERKNFSLFSNKIGQGSVRRLFFPESKETNFA